MGVLNFLRFFLHSVSNNAPLFIMLHFVFFDGTTAFVGSDVDNTSDTEVLFKSYNFDEACDFCDNEMSGI